VEIAITCDDADDIRVEVTDDGIGMTADNVTGRGAARLGLIGMRERVMAMAGSLAIRVGSNERGLSLIVRLPNSVHSHAGTPE
jgi:signal transduction histidine kinase